MKKIKLILIELMFTAIIFAIIYVILAFTLFKWYYYLFDSGIIMFISCIFIFFLADGIYRIIKTLIKK